MSLPFSPAQRAMHELVSKYLRSDDVLPFLHGAQAALAAGNLAGAAGEIRRFLVQRCGYTQYADAFTGKVSLVRFTHDVQTKGGLRFAAGELALATADHLGQPSAFSLRGAVHVSIQYGASYRTLATANLPGAGRA